MMGVPLQCSAILVRERVSVFLFTASEHAGLGHMRLSSAGAQQDFCLLLRLQGLLQGCNSMCAGYLFQQDKQYDVTYDTGDKAIQCGRHVDIFKFWLMWKAKVRIVVVSIF